MKFDSDDKEKLIKNCVEIENNIDIIVLSYQIVMMINK